jgi:outer membrane protein OmpA-like peptidoglycan-associated protein
VTPSGSAVAAAEVTAYGHDTVEGSATGGSGTLELAPGTYTVTGRTEDGQVGTSRVTVPVDPSEAARVEVVLDKVEATSDGKVLRPVAPILFDLGKSDLRADALAIVDDMARWLIADRTVALAEIAGHTDDLGGVAYNQTLSEQRSRAVRDALVARGVAPERLQARGYGLSRPVTKLTDEASRQRNRRVEVRVVSIATE